MIIKSILDTDLYKFTTSYAYMKLFPQARGTFEFIDRDNTEYPEDFIERLYLELGSLVYVPTIRMCSTCIRNRVKDGVGIKPFVRDDVYEIIKQYKLYV